MTPGLTTNCIINHQCIDTKHEVFLLHIKVSLECAETTTVTELDYSLKVDWISHFWDLLDMTIWSHVVTKNVNLVVMWNDANTVIFFFEKKSNYLKDNNKSKGNYFKYKTTKITLTWHNNKIISLRKWKHLCIDPLEDLQILHSVEYF